MSRNTKPVVARIHRIEGSQDGIRFGMVTFGDGAPHTFHYDKLSGAVRLYATRRHPSSGLIFEVLVGQAKRQVVALRKKLHELQPPIPREGQPR